MRAGLGVSRYSNGDVYAGEWANDQKHGQGVVSHKDGSIYTGQFAENEKQGPGIIRLPGDPGITREGVWERGRLLVQPGV